MRKQTIRAIAAVFACGVVSAAMVTNAFAAEETTSIVLETTTMAAETTTTFLETTTAAEETTTTVYTDAPLERLEPGSVIVDVDTKSMYNEFLRLVVLDEGTFTLGTTNGDPNTATDNNAKMLFGFPSGSTSYSTIRVDGESFRYSADEANKPTFYAENKNNVSAMTIGDIFVTETLSFVTNVSTGREDVIEVRYDVVNNGTVAHNVGGRIMFDTMLGSNDQAPFRVPGTGNVTTETEYEGDAIPDYWQAFDSLTNPSIIAQGSFLRNNANPPDKVQFGRWGSMHGTPWNYTITPGNSNGDSAVTAIWNEEELAPGATVTFKTYYGLSELTQDLLPPLALSVYGDSTVNIGVPEEFAQMLFTSYVENIGEGDAENAYVRITLPQGWTLAENSEERIDLETITVGQLKQSSWTINIPTDAELGTYPIKVSCGCDGIDEKSVTRYVTLVRTEYETTAPVAPAPVTTTTTTTAAPAATTTKAAASSAPKTGDAGVSGVAAALLASLGVTAALKRRKKH